MAWTIPDDVVTLIAARTQALAVEADRRAALEAELAHRRALDEQECRALAERVCAFARAFAAAVALPPEGIEVWASHRSRGGDELRVLPGGRLALVSRSGPRPGRSEVRTPDEAAAAWSRQRVEELHAHVTTGAVWDHLRATLK